MEIKPEYLKIGASSKMVNPKIVNNRLIIRYFKLE